MAQLRSSGQVPSPRRSGDPREQGKESISGQGKQHQRHLPLDTLGLGSCTQRAPRVGHSFLRHCADRRRILARTHLHACYLWNSGKLQNRVPEVRGGQLRLRIQCHHCRPGLAKFMAIPHYSYMKLRMTGPQGIITIRADFQGATECFRVAIQAALTTKPLTTSSA
jgi:hypothetical protein